MSLLTKFILLIVLGSAAYFGYQINLLFRVPPLPVLEPKWWGPGKQKAQDGIPQPFKINVTDKVLDDLKYRLNNVRPFTPSLDGIQQQYGMNADLLNEILDFWKNQYNWKAREQLLNKYPQFQVNIQGLKIHYIHVKPQTTNGLPTLPLLLLHGWPGSVREFYEIIPILTHPATNRKFVFELIIPSLPGYGFSDAAVKPGLGPAQIAVIFKNLMERLGRRQFYVQGGDWGSLIASNMAALFPDQVLGMHSNMCASQTPMSIIKLLLGTVFPSFVVPKQYEYKMYPLSKTISYLLLETGYMHIQATKPDTVGVALKESPIGLAAYIIEKFTTWTNPEWKNRKDGGLKLKYKYEDLLDNIMIYWVTGSITTSVRLYSEAFTSEQMSLNLERIPVEVPTACARFAHELLYQSDTILKDKFINLLQINDFPKGGHFAAFEEPELLANDIFSAVTKFRKFHKEAEMKTKKP